MGTYRITSIGCGHCHTLVSVDGPTWPHCPECGHRADVARLYCDCGRCRRGETVSIFPLDLAEALARPVVGPRGEFDLEAALATMPAEAVELVRRWLDRADAEPE